MATLGRLIAIEGIDGAGTTTQTRRLGAALAERGIAAHLTREPSDGPIGLELRRILGGAHAPVDRTAIALLFAADRMDHLHREIAPRLERGEHVLTDRYLLSSLAYQTADVDRELVLAMNARARPPDLTVFIDVPVELAAARRQARGGPSELFDADAFQTRVAAAYRREAALLQATGAPFLAIDGSPDPVAVFAALWPAVQSCLRQGGGAS